MSTIHTIWDAEAEKGREKSAAVHREGHESSERTSGTEYDQRWMLAWSIGTEELVTEIPHKSRKEEFTAPPEVYIG